MANEIERKFLVDDTPAGLVAGTGARYLQGYIAQDGQVEVRVRITEAQSWLTVKGGTGLSRVEVELPLTRKDAEALWPHTLGRRLEKRRYRVHAGDRPADLDLYEGALAGLRTVEVEFASEAVALEYQPPAWFGREVTGDPGWSNASLSRFGRPQ